MYTVQDAHAFELSKARVAWQQFYVCYGLISVQQLSQT